jgi:8-amino-7-oxononanoate synthase
MRRIVSGSSFEFSERRVRMSEDAQIEIQNVTDVRIDTSLPGATPVEPQDGILHRAAAFLGLYERTAGIEENPFSVVVDEMLSPVEAIISGNHTTLFGTNSYLGLNFHPDCIAAATETVKKYGTGSTASRVAGGNQALHNRLETYLREWYGAADAVVYSTGFMANLSVVSALAKEGCAVLLDAHCHASLFDACRLSKGKIATFEHNSAADLDRLLRTSDVPGSRTVVIVEGLYSVWGDLCDLKPLLKVAHKHNALIVVDEAHSFGLYGAEGRGLCEELGVEHEVDVIVGTFSKSVGVIGGYSVTRHPQLRALRMMARPYLFTASLPPTIIASAQMAMGLIRNGADLRQKVWANAHTFHSELSGMGYRMTAEACPVGGVRLPHARTGFEFWRELLRRGVYVNILIPPATPGKDTVLRFSLSAAHGPQHIEKGLSVFQSVGKDLGVIP